MTVTERDSGCAALVHLALTCMRDTPQPGDVPTAAGIVDFLNGAGEQIGGKRVHAEDVLAGLRVLRERKQVLAFVPGAGMATTYRLRRNVVAAP